MTSQQRDLILPLLLSLGNVRTMDQVNIVWNSLELACRSAGVSIGNKPTSIPQAKSLAVSLRKRIIGLVK